MDEKPWVKSFCGGKPNYCTPEHEPVAWANAADLQNFDMRVRTNCDLMHTVPLYTAPPKREWVGLNDEEIYDYADKFLYQHGSNYGIRSFGKAIEAKLKEKNGG
jgi:hypothetical protein